MGYIDRSARLLGTPDSNQTMNFPIRGISDRPSWLATLVVCCGVVVVDATHGQTQAAVRSVSIQFGSSFSTWAGRSIRDIEDELNFGYGYRTGLAVRVTAFQALSDIVGLQIGAHYVQKGTTLQGLAGRSSGDKFINQTGYLEFPVLMRTTFVPDGVVSPYLVAGAALSLRLSCTDKIEFTLVDANNETVSNGSESFDCDVDTEARAVDLGVAAGVGLNFAVLPSLSLALDFLYSYSLRSISDIERNGDLPDDEFDVRNRTYSIVAGIRIPLP